MNRKRNDFEYNEYENNQFVPMAKRIKSPLPPSFDKLHLNSSAKSSIISDLSPQVLKRKIWCNRIDIFFLLSFYFCENSRQQECVLVENEGLGLYKTHIKPMHQ